MAEKTVRLTIENVQSAIDRLESIDINDEFAYEKAILTYVTIKFLPTVQGWQVASPGVDVLNDRAEFLHPEPRDSGLGIR